MRSRLYASEKIAVRFLRYACLLFLLPVFSFPGTIYSAGADDADVIAFFRSVEDSFRNQDVNEIVGHVHRDLSYIMTYSTNDNFSILESDFEKYRTNVISFFKSRPKIREYSITVDDIHRSGNDVMVVVRLKSVVLLNGTITSCDASSNYLIQKVNSAYLIRDVRGDATCTNTEVN